MRNFWINVAQVLVYVLYGVVMVALWLISIPFNILSIMMSSRDGCLILGFIFAIVWVSVFGFPV